MKIIILNQNDGSVHIFNFNLKLKELDNFEIIDFYNEINKEFGLHLKDSECSYMITDNLNIQIY